MHAVGRSEATVVIIETTRPAQVGLPLTRDQSRSLPGEHAPSWHTAPPLPAEQVTWCNDVTSSAPGHARLWYVRGLSGKAMLCLTTGVFLPDRWRVKWRLHSYIYAQTHICTHRFNTAHPADSVFDEYDKRTSTKINKLHCASCSAVYCNRSCLFVGFWLCLWVCYHDNSKLRPSILTKLGS